MNQAEAAVELDVSEATISRLVSGERRPSVGLITVINDRWGWSAASQIRCMSRDSYAANFKERMDARESTVRRVPGVDSGGDRVPTLETREEGDDQTGAGGRSGAGGESSGATG